MAAKLKGLFVLFAGYLVKNCASLLDAANISKTGKMIRNVELDHLNAGCDISPHVIIPSIRHFDIAQEIGSVYCPITSLFWMTLSFISWLLEACAEN